MDQEVKYQDIMVDSESESSFVMRNIPINELSHLTADGEEVEKPRPNPRGLLPLCLPEIARLKNQPIKTVPNSYMSILPPPDIICHAVPPRIEGLEVHHSHNPLNLDASHSPRSPLMSPASSPKYYIPSIRQLSPCQRSPSASRLQTLGFRREGMGTSRSTPIFSGHRAGLYSRGIISQRMSTREISPTRMSCQNIPLRQNLSQNNPFDPVEEYWEPRDRFQNARFMGEQISGHVNTGKLGQGPASYRIGATVAAKCISSTKYNVPKYTFSTTSRFDYTSTSKASNKKPMQLNI
mmetsp:Transcript_6229/g.8437  ORF Transcript_6229/g.8437 Transcript_6229/m.8437 type:complete len:294 (+) Transcript_6229:126-1007(+)